MTLGETELAYSETCDDILQEANGMEEAGCALRDVLLRASLDNRLTCGVYQAAMKLDMEPERVFLCIHTDLCVNDVALQLHFSLMEAFCWENQIRLLKVSDTEATRKLLEEAAAVAPDVQDTPVDLMDLPDQLPCSRTSQDYSCVLVEIPEKMDSACTTLLAHYQHLAEATPFPHITLAT